MEQFDEHVKRYKVETWLDRRTEAERQFDREHSRIQRVLTDKKQLRMGPKCLPEGDRIWLIRQGLTACHWCHDIFPSTGGGKTKSRWCMPRCKDRGRRSRNTLEVKRMGKECYEVWKSLRGDREAQEQYVQWIMFLADKGWRWSWMFKHRYSMARNVIEQHYGEFDEGPKVLGALIARPTVARWKMPTATRGITGKPNREQHEDWVRRKMLGEQYGIPHWEIPKNYL